METAGIIVCPRCGTQLAPSLRSCPACRRLVHGEQLRQLATEAEKAERAADFPAALTAWRTTLDLLPPGSRQHAGAMAKVEELSRKVDAVPVSPAGKPAARGAGGKITGALGAVALLLWKFKVLLVFLATKGKLLLLGLTKASTLFSMLLSMGAYWTVWGWKFAAGLVLSIYVHEMGHVAALRRYGIPASAPMFIPGVGAFVRLKQAPVSPREDAAVGLAGPMWGLGAAVAAWLVSLAASWPAWAAIAKVGAWLNLFNLLPVWQLDGGRGFQALGAGHRWAAAGVIGLSWFITGEALLFLLLLAAAGRAAFGSAPAKSERNVLFEYAFLILTLSGLCMITPKMP